MKIGYCFTGSFCTFERSIRALAELVKAGHDVVPIMSENAYYTDTKFQKAEEFSTRVEALCQKRIIHTVVDAEPLGPSFPLDVLIVAPCTGNTLAKEMQGISDTAATMAIKAHLRADRPMLLAIASNDAMSANLANIARALSRRSVYLVPMRQDDPISKPHSLVAELERIPECIEALQRGEQVRPLFV
jgi:dipicolinate synthase subunit B